jgi:uncharacterized protein (TIGR00730 family)
MSELSNDPIVCDNEATMDVVEGALANLWGVANTLSRLRPSAHERFSVTVFGSARIQPGQTLYEDVKRLAKILSESGCDIITGGGPGVMRAANEGAVLGDPDDNTESVGIRIALPFEKNPNPFVEQAYTHQTFHTRLHHFVRRSDAFVVVGGGIGTTLELFMIWQLLQVKHIKGDVPLITVGEQWSDVVGWAKKHMLSHEPNLANPEDMNTPIAVATIEECVELLAPRITQFKQAKAQKERSDGA